MSRGSYRISNQSTNGHSESKPPREDSSFKLFICVLITFLVFCVILILITTFINRKGKYSDGDSNEKTFILKNIEEHSSEESSRIIKHPEKTSEDPDIEEVSKRYYHHPRGDGNAIIITTEKDKEVINGFTEERKLLKILATEKTQKIDDTTELLTSMEVEKSSEQSSWSSTITEKSFATEKGIKSTEAEILSSSSVDTKTEESFTYSKIPETITSNDNLLNTTENAETKFTIKPNLTETFTTPSLMETISKKPHDIVRRESNKSLENKSGITTIKDPICRNPSCDTTASRMLGLMNHSVDACEDFYEFACGGVASSIEKNADAHIKDTLSIHLNWANKSPQKYFNISMNFYESCLVFHRQFKYNERLQKFKDLLRKFGNFTENPVDLTKLFENLILIQSLPLFDLGLDVDIESNYILQLTVPGGSALKNKIDNWSALLLHKMRCLQQQQPLTYSNHLDLEKIYDNYQMCQKNYTFYLNKIDYVLGELGVDSSLKAHVLSTIKTFILELLKDLPKQADINVNLRTNFLQTTLSQIQKQFSLLQWKSLIKNLAGCEISEETPVQLYFESFLTKVFSTLEKLKDYEINNALLAILAVDLYENVVVSESRTDIISLCQEQFTKLFPDIVQYFTHSDYPQDEFKDKQRNMVNLFKQIQSKFAKSFVEIDWITKDTQLLLGKKCNYMKLEFYQPTIDDEKYKNLEVFTNFQENLIEIILNQRKSIYSLIGKKLTIENIFSNFIDATADAPFIIYPLNLIMVPPQFVRVADFSLPGYVIMAQIGYPLAKEMVRHFDPIGLKYNETDISKQPQYIDLVDYTKKWDFSNPRIFQKQNISFKFNGLLSVNSRITENGAFRLVSDLWNFGSNDALPWISTSYSREKVFFIATTQGYCKKSKLLEFLLNLYENELPETMKIENIMGNSEFFSEIFQCAEGAGMNSNFHKLQFPYLNLGEQPNNYYDD